MFPTESLQPPTPPESPVKNRKGLAIVLLIASVLFIVAIVVAVWVLLHKSGTQTNNEPSVDVGDTRTVTDVFWEAPVPILAGYTQIDEYTQDSKVTVYKNPTEGCNLVSRVVPSGKDALHAVLVGLEMPGVVNGAQSPVDAHAFADIDGVHSYEFAAFRIDQAVSVPSISFSSQTVIVYYKQFNAQVASLSATCKAGAAAQLTALTDWALQFKVKTERQN